MTIERYKFRPGVAVSLGKDLLDDVAGIIVANQRTKEILPEGEYDLTPEIWVKHGSNRYRYNLIVNEDGTAIYRLLSTGADSMSILKSQEQINTRMGGRVINIPQDGEIAIVAGPKRDDETVRVYDIVVFNPGPSPKKTL